MEIWDVSCEIVEAETVRFDVPEIGPIGADSTS